MARVSGLVLIELGEDRSVVRSVAPSVTFLNCERFSHYCSCPSVRDWIAMYPVLFTFSLSLNKAGYTAEQLQTVGQEWKYKNHSQFKNVTYRRTDGWTDMARCRVMCPRLNIEANCILYSTHYQQYS